MLETILEYLNTGRGEEMTQEMALRSLEQSQEAIRLTMQLNTQYHTPEEIVRIMRELTGEDVDESFRLFPPFYTDFGRNIHLGKDVFINSSCHFQDQAVFSSETMCSSATMSSWLPLTMIWTRWTGGTIMRPSASEAGSGSAPARS